jgi:DNA polymerase
MYEPRRQGYLKAMGITPWRRRARDAEPSPQSLDPRAAPFRGADSPAAPTPPGDEVAALDWPALRERVRDCRACELRAGCTQTVFGVGDTAARLLVIGEAPGADEDRQGEPFVGRAGQLLNAMLKAMGYPREAVFIANIVKCRPPGNRDPGPEEALRCEPYLLRQIELIRPRVILAVGRVAAQNLLKTQLTVGKLRGRVHAFAEGGIPLVVTYHPAYLLRSPEQKGKAWQDLQLALGELRSDGP